MLFCSSLILSTIGFKMSGNSVSPRSPLDPTYEYGAPKESVERPFLSLKVQVELCRNVLKLAAIVSSIKLLIYPSTVF